ncbi:MAG: DUF3127 domain-containing protein [Cytophagaceae bacterium]
MELKGKITNILPLQSGQGKNGEWKKQDFILETASQYPKKVCITVWGDKIDQFDIKEGESLTASIELESREFNGRWYTDVRAWKVQKDSESGSTPPPLDESASLDSFSGEEPDDLPF